MIESKIIDVLKREIQELRARQDAFEMTLKELMRPREAYLKELAGELSRGNWDALKAHNRAQKTFKEAGGGKAWQTTRTALKQA